MGKVGKKYSKAKEQVGSSVSKTWKDAIDLIVKTKHVKFDESVDADMVLGIDPEKGEQTVRGSIMLPHGIGKTTKVLVFAKDEYADQAQKAGADYVGLEDLIEKISGGWLDFDVSVATPDVMGQVGKVAKILGPRGLLPNKKVGTVTFEIAEIISDLKKGRVSYRNDKASGLHVKFGKVSLGAEKLLDNLRSLMKSVVASKPSSAKGKFIKKITISSSMGIGISINPDEIA